MKRIYIFLGVSLILLFLLLSCYGIATPEVQIWTTNPHGFSVAQFDSTIVDMQPRGGGQPYYNPDPIRWWLDTEGVTKDSVAGMGEVWMVPLSHYYSEVIVDSVTFWVRNGVDSYLEGYYCEFYQSTVDTLLYTSPNYSNLGLRIKASSSREDTLKVSLYNFSFNVREAVKMMYIPPPDPYWKTVQVKVHFYGTDDYDEGKEFNVSQDYMLYRTD